MGVSFGKDDIFYVVRDYSSQKSEFQTLFIYIAEASKSVEYRTELLCSITQSYRTHTALAADP
jgi:hypothetical protein